MMKLNQLNDYLVNKGYSRTTIAEHLRSVREFLNWIQAENIEPINITYNDMTAYIGYLQGKQVKPSSINQRLNSLKHYFRYMKYKGCINQNPALNIHVKSLVNSVFSGGYPEAILRHLYDTFLNHRDYYRPNEKASHMRYKALLGLIIFQGLSASDLKKLLVTDINLEQGTIYVPESRRANQRLLKLEAVQILPLMDYLNHKLGERLVDTRINDLLRFMIAKLNRLTSMEVSVQQLRASRIVIWLKQYNIRQVQYYTGIKYLSSLEKYRQQEIDNLRDRLDKCFPDV